jgi:hypothetical protein
MLSAGSTNIHEDRSLPLSAARRQREDVLQRLIAFHQPINHAVRLMRLTGLSDGSLST